MAMVVPMAILVEVQITSSLYHGFKMGVGCILGADWIATWCAAWFLDRLRSGLRRGGELWKQATLQMSVNTGITDVQGGENKRQYGLCSF